MANQEYNEQWINLVRTSIKDYKQKYKKQEQADLQKHNNEVLDKICHPFSAAELCEMVSEDMEEYIDRESKEKEK